MAGRRPDYDVKTPLTEANGKTRWVKIGVAWKNVNEPADISIELNALPFGRKVCLFAPDTDHNNEK